MGISRTRMAESSLATRLPTSIQPLPRRGPRERVSWLNPMCQMTAELRLYSSQVVISPRFTLRLTGSLPWLLLAVFMLLTVTATSAAIAGDQEPAAGANAPDRPKISFYRWQEDWSVLADQRLRTGVLDSLKYIPLAADDPSSYLSFGLTVRERFEVND